MSASLITKKTLASAMKQLMEKIPLSKISIRDIVNACGLNRQTFYYHFKDKFDLVNWIYYNEAIESIADCSNYQLWSLGIRRILLYLLENKAFYLNALNTPGQNGFDRYLFEVTHALNMKVINEVATDMNISAFDKNFIADFYTFAFVGLTIQWIKKGMKESPATVSERIKDIVDGSLPRTLTKCAK